MSHAQHFEYPLLHVSVDRTRTHLFIRLRGELDLSTTDRVGAAVHGAEHGETHSAVFDLSGLTFCDASGLRELLTAHERLSDTHQRIRFEGVRPSVLRIMRITGVDTLLGPTTV